MTRFMGVTAQAVLINSALPGVLGPIVVREFEINRREQG
jgi:hypothetical protein